MRSMPRTWPSIRRRRFCTAGLLSLYPAIGVLPLRQHTPMGYQEEEAEDNSAEAGDGVSGRRGNRTGVQGRGQDLDAVDQPGPRPGEEGIGVHRVDGVGGEQLGPVEE